MKKLRLASTFALSVILLAGCMNKAQENIEAEIIEEENVIVKESENVEDEIIEKVVEEEDVIDWERWNLLAFNWKEVDWNYMMTITNDGKLYTKFCNDMWWDVTFDWNESEWTISVSLSKNQIWCEWEYMDLENTFQIDWANYNTIVNEDGWKTMIITTLNWDKFTWRSILN